MIPEKVIIRYIRARELSLKGERGEREAALAALTRMEQAHPGIKQAVAYYDQLQKAKKHEPTNGAADPTPGVWPKPGAPRATRAPTAQPGPAVDPTWDTLFQFAEQAWSRARGFAETVGNMALGKDLAQHVGSGTRVGRSGGLILSLKLPLAVCQKIPLLNPIQQRAFRDALHMKLEGELDAVFGTESD